MEKEKPDLLDWLHIKKELDFTKLTWLGGAISAIGFVTLLAIVAFSVLGIFLLFGGLVGFGPFSGDPTGAALRNLGLLLVATFGAPFLVWRSIVAQKQVNVAEQSQITDRINKAVEGLGSEKTVREIIETPRYQKDGGKWKKDKKGSPLPALRPDGMPLIDREVAERTTPNLEVRIGAIYALERIAQDSRRDHIQIMEILCAYVRENAPAGNLDLSEDLSARPTPRTDIQIVISVLGRRSVDQVTYEHRQEFRLDLRNSDLSGVDLRNGQFAAAMFHECRMEAARFNSTNLDGAQFFGSLLNHSEFHDANLKGARLDLVVINKPEIPLGGMSYSITHSKNYGVSVSGADISAITYLGEADDRKLIFGSKDTKLDHRLEFDRVLMGRNLYKLEKLRKELRHEEADQFEAELAQLGFVFWIPYDRQDGTLGWYYAKFLDRLGLEGWPYR